MIDPAYIVAVEHGTEVFEDGYGMQRVHQRVCITDYYSDFWLPPENNRPAIKCHGAHGKIYIAETDIKYIVNLSDDDLSKIECDI